MDLNGILLLSSFLLLSHATKINLPDLQDQTMIGLRSIDHISWTNESLPDDGKKVYKDTLMEKLIQRFFDTFIAKVKDPKIAGEQILQDPMPINEKIGNNYTLTAT